MITLISLMKFSCIAEKLSHCFVPNFQLLVVVPYAHIHVSVVALNPNGNSRPPPHIGLGLQLCSLKCRVEGACIIILLQKLTSDLLRKQKRYTCTVRRYKNYQGATSKSSEIELNQFKPKQIVFKIACTVLLYYWIVIYATATFTSVVNFKQ